MSVNVYVYFYQIEVVLDVISLREGVQQVMEFVCPLPLSNRHCGALFCQLRGFLNKGAQPILASVYIPRPPTGQFPNTRTTFFWDSCPEDIDYI